MVDGAFDVVVLGGGNAALCAALSAAEQGAKQWTARSLRPADVLAALPEVWRAWKDVKPDAPPVLAQFNAPEVA